MLEKKCFYLLIITVLFVFGSVVKADTYSKFETTNYYSKNREFFVIVTPDKKAVLYKGNKKIWTQTLPELPQSLLVTNDGKRVVMIENYYGNSREPKKEVINFFGENGNKLSSYNLENLADLENILHTISSSHWLDKYEMNQEKNEVVIETFVLTCPLIGNVSNEEDLKKVDECRKPKPKERIVFSVVNGSLLSRTKIETTEK